jgi:hypothetical protein
VGEVGNYGIQLIFILIRGNAAGECRIMFLIVETVSSFEV